MANEPWLQLSFQAGQVFTPGAPISERELFSGRIDQISRIIDTVSQTGYHVVLYGERGVGKTSLSNVLSSFLQSVEGLFHLPRVNCDARDTYTSLWQKLFRNLRITETRPGVGFAASDIDSHRKLVDDLPEELTPDDVRTTLQILSRGIILVPIFDEFDRIGDVQTSTLMADTIKGLSDYSVASTVIIIGVAESVDELIKEHHSIERALVQIPMPRMSNEEIGDIISNGLTKLEMSIEDGQRRTIASLSQGLPYVTHLLALHAAKSAINRESRMVEQDDVRRGISIAVDQWQQSNKNAYYNATKSHQPENIFRQVILACAFADTDEFGYFSAANVRDPLRLIVPARQYDIPHFARHLQKFSSPERGNLLERMGSERRWRYRFTNPLMRPYIIMRGFDDGTINGDQLRALSESLGGGDMFSRIDQ